MHRARCGSHMCGEGVVVSQEAAGRTCVRLLASFYSHGFPRQSDWQDIAICRPPPHRSEATLFASLVCGCGVCEARMCAGRVCWCVCVCVHLCALACDRVVR